MKRSLMAALLVSQMGQVSLAETPPEWAKDAVDTVQQRGIMKGYPDGSVGGDKAVKRDELAEMIERLDSQNDQSEFATKAELDETRAQAAGLRDGVQSLDVRVENLENGSGQLDERADHSDRPHF